VASGFKLTLISAAAGFGKTTLLSEWVSQSDTAVAWVSLDEGDNDPIRFLTYFVAALQTLALSDVEGIAANLGEGVMAALQSPQPPATEALLTTLINQISATLEDPVADARPAQLRSPGSNIVLVLDDYHLITAQPVHDALGFLLDHLPGYLHLVIATRSDPPLPLARLRGRGLLTELREIDLRFTLDEASRFIEKVMGLELSVDDLMALTTRTEGWIAGLQMAAVSMQSRERIDDSANTISDFIAAFSGSNRFILDYLVEEVLQSQPDSIQTFLLHTAVLERLTAPLCDAILGRADAKGWERVEQSIVSSQDTLEHLESVNLFIVSLDDERRWYRYHHLFTDLLRNQLHKRQPGLHLTLHRRASQWFEREGLIPEAMHHAIAIESFDRAAILLESIVSPLLNESRPATLLSLMDQLPDETIASRPWLAIHGAWAYFLTWQFDAIEPLLQSVELKLSVNSTEQPSEMLAKANRIHVRMIVLRAFMAQSQGDLAAATDLSYQALNDLDEDDLQLRSVLETNLGDICLKTNDLASARRHMENSLAAGKSAGNFYSALSAVSRLAELDVMQGRLHQASKTYHQAIQLGVEWGGGQPMPGNGRAHVGLAQVLYEWNDLDGAASHLKRGIHLGKECGEQEIVLQGYLTLARLRQAQGNADAATKALEQAATIAPSDSRILPTSQVSSWQARNSLARGELTAASRWADSQESTLDMLDIPDLRVQESALTLVRVWIAQDKIKEATRLLEQWLLAAETAGRVGSVIEIRILSSLALQTQGLEDQAMSSLERALLLAEPGGFVRIFVDEGPSVARLLYEAARRGIAPEQTGNLLTAFSPSEPAATSRKRPGEMVEPLSERELDVLLLIAGGLSNQEVSQRLFISLATVKWHTSNIYGKLGVKNRTQAVAQARALGILPKS
jgi:LuxR family maltose regulon positive regulatory protein